ncbi:alpha/beta-hydrolase family protein [Hoyosella rhizosphaerae]|uniref:Membrane protein n=1 Tax=Hoyosella rhizosphaerae TaxID=1755582 RepID=A0A916XI87_9ACTN|nr:alpha/beta-hydrolase family protein [Hoyosella rhizosphaerae]MBN4928260.1 alpha/beta-hydrolase family protein [Hoyosella rhizosphaerae]GGC73617.1 membrane protein [Hoyosella rhizosphaerae]
MHTASPVLQEKPEPTVRPATQVGRYLWHRLRLDLTGLAFAGLFFAWSMTPSLLPREWTYQGLVSGISLAAGYGTGVVLAWFVRSVVFPLLEWPPPSRTVVWWTRGLTAVGTVSVMVSALVAAAEWQNEIRALLGMDLATTQSYFRAGLSAIVIAAAIVFSFRVLRAVVRFIGSGIRKLLHLPVPIVNALGIVIVSALIITLVNGVLVRGLVLAANSAFSVQNAEIEPRVRQPAEPERSGSPESFAAWETLGLQGRRIVSRGLRAAELEHATGEQSQEPIRVYVGLDSAPTIDDRVELALAELDRTGAFDREVLVVATTTGTGWINPNATQALELIYRGDTAFVGLQYSFLPSALSFLVDQDVAAEAGKKLFDAVYAEWQQRDPETRPRMFVYGESLGSYGSEAAFEGLADLREKVSGALWVGPMNMNRLWRSLTERRDPGSPQIQPTYAGGLVVRFANQAADLPSADELAAAPWLEPRVLYLQHPTDPVVWWSPELLFQRPDWLREPPGYDVSPSMRWRPIVTFWQVASDLANAGRIPYGHGHLYGSLILDGWIAIAAPDEWTDADTDHAHEVMGSLSQFLLPRQSPISEEGPTQ